MKKKYFPIIIIIAVSIFCCTQIPTPSADYMIFDEVVFIEKFPQTIQLQEPVQVFFDEAYGVFDFVICDTLLIFSTSNPEGMWGFYSIPEYKWIGRFISQGKGPYEFIFTPWMYGILFLTKDEILFATIYDYQRGRVLEMNVSKTLVENKLNISIINDTIVQFLQGFIKIDNDTFFCRKLSEDITQNIRFLLINNISYYPKSFEKLNNSAVLRGEDHNLLASIINRNSKTGRIVEVPVKLNYLNLYSIDDSFKLTICTHKKLDNISSIIRLKRENRINRHGDLKVYDNMFGVLCINEEWGIYELDRKKLPIIQFFNMDGKPLAELKLNRFATSFDIDFNNGYLYIHDRDYDEFYKYDIKEILQKINDLL